MSYLSKSRYFISLYIQIRRAQGSYGFVEEGKGAVMLCKVF